MNKSIIMAVCIFVTICCEGKEKFDRVIPALPTKEELLQYKNKYEFIAFVKISTKRNKRIYQLDDVLKGSVSDQDYNEYIPDVDSLARDGALYLFFLGNGNRGKIAKLIAIQEDRIESIADKKVLFKGYSKEELLSILK